MSTSIRLKQSTAWVALLALASAAAGANPEDTEEVQTENVNYEDLNLASLAGVTQLYGRIKRSGSPRLRTEHRPVAHGSVEDVLSTGRRRGCRQSEQPTAHGRP